MIFRETTLKGAFIIDLEKVEDERGFFARSWCRREFGKQGLSSDLVQCNVSFNKRKGTLRGMHYQTAPYQEAKLVRCTRGAVYDVIVDLRSDSGTFCQWTAAELTAANVRMIFVPQGFAHGFLTLADNTEVSYQMSEFYSPQHATGVRWNDPAFGIEWPIGISLISDRDNCYPDFSISDRTT